MAYTLENGNIVKAWASSCYGSAHMPLNAFYTGTPLTGGSNWRSYATPVGITSYSLTCQFNSAKVITYVWYSNFFDCYDDDTTYYPGSNTSGSAGFTLYGSNDNSNWTEITSGTFAIHPAANVASGGEFAFSNSTAYTYYLFYVSASHGGHLAAIRRLQLYSGSTTPPTRVPTVTTTSISGILATGATGGGNVTSGGGATVTARGVCWNDTGSPTTADSKTTDGTGTGLFVSTLSGLTKGKKYYVRAYATNSQGTGYGSQVEFTTLDVPKVTTAAATDITGISAKVSGAITDTGGENASTIGICWNTGGTPTTADSKYSKTSYKAYGVGTFSGAPYTASPLLPKTKYYVRAYAINSVGTGYGNEIELTTLAFPTVTTTAISSIAGTTASSGGNVTNEGDESVTARGVCWNTTGSPTTADSKTSDGSGSGAFVSSITGLTRGVTYYVRAYATSSVGTAYGEEVSFTTLTVPTMATKSVKNITKATALVECEIVAIPGAAKCTTRGICWSTSANPTTADSKAFDNGGGTYDVGGYTKTASGLSPVTRYYVRAYAINSEGTAYGAQLSFVTLSKAATIAPQYKLTDTYYLGRTGRYSLPQNSNDRLPLVYGDLTDSSEGNWKLPCIDTNTYVYCFAAHEVLSVANGNSITIYENGVEVDSGDYAFDESNDYEGEGVIATVTFSTPKTGSTITARGMGKPTTSGGATLMENIIDILEDVLTVELDMDIDFEETYKATARDDFEGQSYVAAGVIYKDIKIWDLILMMMGSFLGSAYMNGAGELVLEIDDGTYPPESFSGVIRKSDADFKSASMSLDNLINRCPASYAYDYATGNEFKNHSDGVTTASSASEHIYGVREPTLPYKFYWCRDAASVAVMQQIIVDKLAYPLWTIEFDDITMKRLDSDVGKLIAYSVDRLYDKDMNAMLNTLWKVISYNPDIQRGSIGFRAIETGFYLTHAYIANGDWIADGSIKAGNNRDVTNYG